MFENIDFAETADVPFFAREVRAEKGMNAFQGRLGANYARPEDQDVHIVVFDSLVGRVGVVAEAGADAFNFVGRDAGSDARATDEHASFGLMMKNGVANFRGKIGVVDCSGGIGSDVHNLMALCFKVLADQLLEIVPCVITADDDEHASKFSGTRRRQEMGRFSTRRAVDCETQRRDLRKHA